VGSDGDGVEEGSTSRREVGLLSAILVTVPIAGREARIVDFFYHLLPAAMAGGQVVEWPAAWRLALLLEV
jgi:hypothetical protein